MEKIKKKFNELRDFLNQKIKQIRKDLFRIENKKIKEIGKNLLRLEKNFSKLKIYYDYDVIEYRGIADIKNLFDLSVDEDYWKPIKTNDDFNNNYIEYKIKEDKNKTLSIKEYLNMIRPYLSDINDHKTQAEWKVHSNTVIHYKSQEEWKIQLTMIINFISSKDSDEIRTMRTKSI